MRVRSSIFSIEPSAHPPLSFTARRGCLSLLSWNCNGIIGKILELREFVQEHSPDIIFLQETHCRPGINFKIPNYSILRFDYNNPNGPRGIRGTAICVKNNLNFIPVSTIQLNCINATGITLYLAGSPPLTFFSVYLPPTENPKNAITDISKLLQFGDNTLLLGDFNAHHPLWNCNGINEYGTGIYNLILRSNADIIFPDSHTHFDYRSSSTIDFGLFRGFNYVMDIQSLAELSSDHNPITVKIQIQIPAEPHKIISRTNWAQFTHIINNITTPLPLINSNNDIDLLVDTITLEIKNAVDAATTKKPANEFYKLDPNVRILTTNKNRARKIWQNSRRPEDKIVMNRAQQDLKNYLFQKRQETWSEYLENLSPQDSSIWKAARRFKSSVNQLPPIIIPNTQTYAFTNEEKANAIAMNLDIQFQGNPIIDYETEREVNLTVSRFLRQELPPNLDVHISNADVAQQIRKLPNKKSPGISGITNEVLKNLPISYIPKITLLINNILKFSYFPFHWKTALIAPILKNSKPPEQASSYRPISLLNSLSKLAEVFIARQIDEFIDINNILEPVQFGFRKDLSAPHQVYRLVEQVTTGMSQKQFTAAVFLDIEKAFDKVWIHGLIYKLIKLNFPPTLIKLIFSYLSDRNFHVKVKDSLSQQFFASFGLPQGSKISPKLFNLFINDMPNYPHTHLAKYADDTCIYATNKNRRYAILAISSHLKILSTWFYKWRIALNIGKTESILFSRLRQDNRDKYKITFNNNPLPWSKHCKYLGVILDQGLTFQKHIHTTRNKFRVARRKLFPLIARNSKLSTKNKLLLYTSYLRPILTYACMVWSYAAKTNIKLLLTAQNSTLRLILDLPWYIRNTYMYNEINIPKLSDFIEHLNSNFHLDLQYIDNTALQSLPAYDHNDPANRKRPKTGLRLNSLL